MYKDETREQVPIENKTLYIDGALTSVKVYIFFFMILTQRIDFFI